MAIDNLQDKIRKLKNPSVLELGAFADSIPPQITKEVQSNAEAAGMYARELLTALKGIIPAVRISFGVFALYGVEGIRQLEQVIGFARDLKYYVMLDAPEILSPMSAQCTADALMGEASLFPCDAVVISGYLGSDVIKPFLPYCKKSGKDLFVISRTANKSAPELQDLLTGSRLVHEAAADHVNRHGAGTVGKHGFSSVGILAAASAAESTRSLRNKYPGLFLLLDGYDYPNANAKNCSFAFDKFGHGAAVCIGSSIACAWKQGPSEGVDYAAQAVAAAERAKKNITRYVTIL